MIEVKKVKITNYKSCTKTNVDLLTNLTTLIGVNGAGKSNILNSLNLLTKIFKYRFFSSRDVENVGLLSAEICMSLKVEPIDYELKITVYYQTDEDNIENIYSSEIKYKCAKGRWRVPETDSLRHVRIYRSESKRRKKYTNRFEETDRMLLNYLANISYYSATQFSDPRKCPLSIEIEDDRPFRKNRTHDLFIYELYRNFKDNKHSFEKFLGVVGKGGIGLVDDITFYERKIPNSSLKVMPGGSTKIIERTRKIVIPSVVVDGLKLSPNQLSEGTFKTLALVFYILNDKSDLLMIEEPEVCVHHGLLSSIVELIKIQSKKKQIIISTHSDLVLDKLKPENVVLVTKTIDKGTVASALSKSMSKNDFDTLKRYLESEGNLGEFWRETGFEEN